jgi:hypothetical protein
LAITVTGWPGYLGRDEQKPHGVAQCMVFDFRLEMRHGEVRLLPFQGPPPQTLGVP